MTWYVGLDIGAFTSKAALARDGEFVDAVVVPSGTDYAKSGRQALDAVMARNGVERSELGSVVGTGIGGERAGIADRWVTDIICSARGVASVLPEVRTVIDVGSQSTRVIWLDEQGRVADFAVNEKCATGSGRFLLVIANVLRIGLEEVGPLSLRSTKPVTFTTGCAVFGESEAITRVSEGAAKEDILAGVHRSLAEKIGGLIRGRGLSGECALCGGGALDAGLVLRLEQELKRELRIPELPHVITARGASVLAAQGLGDRRVPEERAIRRRSLPSNRSPREHEPDV